MHSRLPSAFQSVPETQPEVDSDGRVRTYAHERGQWTCHVFAEVDEEIVSRVADSLETGADSSFNVILEPHLSLFRGNCVLRQHHISLVVGSMQQKLSKLQPFSVPLMMIKTLQNEDQSRSFVCLCSDAGPSNKLQGVLVAVRDCLKDFTDVRDYVEEFIPHVSLLWFVNKNREIDSAVQKLQQEFGENPLLIRVTHVELKVGNRSYSISLKNV